eukprot:6455942-Amphidinium_carterae.3
MTLRIHWQFFSFLTAGVNEVTNYLRLKLNPKIFLDVFLDLFLGSLMHKATFHFTARRTGCTHALCRPLMPFSRSICCSRRAGQQCGQYDHKLTFANTPN